MCRSIILVLISLSLYSCSQNQDKKEEVSQKEKANFDAISNQVFEFIQNRYPHEFDAHSQHNHNEDHVHFEADPDLDDHLIGNLSCYPILATGELYEIDLNNDRALEYVCLLGLTPGLSWTQHILVLNGEGEILDSLDIKTREGVCHMTFEHLQYPDQYNLLIEWQQNMSIDENSGLFIYSFQNNKFNRILNQKLHWKISDKRINGPKNPNNIKEVTNAINLLDSNKDGVKEIELTSKFVLRNDTDSSSMTILTWKGGSFTKQ